MGITIPTPRTRQNRRLTNPELQNFEGKLAEEEMEVFAVGFQCSTNNEQLNNEQLSLGGPYCSCIGEGNRLHLRHGTHKEDDEIGNGDLAFSAGVSGVWSVFSETLGGGKCDRAWIQRGAGGGGACFVPGPAGLLCVGAGF